MGYVNRRDKGDGGDDDNETKGFPVQGIHADKPCEIANAHTEDQTGLLFIYKGNGERGTGVESTGPTGGPGIGTGLGRFGDQPTDPCTGMFHRDALQQASCVHLASLLQYMQNDQKIKAQSERQYS